MQHANNPGIFILILWDAAADMPTFLPVFLCAAVLSCVLVGLVRRHALRKSILDIPNERSSHSRPTPRGGGAGFVPVILAGVVFAAFSGHVRGNFALALAAGGGATALVGWLDDRRGLSIRLRFAVHFLAALWALLWLGSPVPQWGAAGIPAAAFFVFVTVCLVNSYNFMDGIDAFAGGEAVLAGAFGAALLRETGAAWPCLLVAASALGFLVWNRPPAKIFMGDAGSCFLGYAFALVWWEGTIERPESFFTVPLLLGAFIVDSALTMLWRMFRGEKWYAAHKLHVYQTYAALHGHGRVVAAYLFVMVAWLAPMAWCAERYFAAYGACFAVSGYLPLLGVVGWVHLRRTGWAERPR